MKSIREVKREKERGRENGEKTKGKGGGEIEKKIKAKRAE